MYQTFFSSRDETAVAPRTVPAQSNILPTAQASKTNQSKFCSNEVINSKYTLLSFIPLNLYEQFRRPLNVYFLLVGVLQFIPVIAPVNPLSTLMPLLFAFTLTAVKEGYDDKKRHQMDNEFNYRKVHVLRNGVWTQKFSKDIIVGDIVKVLQGGEFPCDVLLLGTEGGGDLVHIQTDNLDGETDLKKKIVPKCLRGTAIHDWGTVTVGCDAPHQSITVFAANINIESVKASGTADNESFIPSTCLLKNTINAVGIALYTGKQTKISLSKKTPQQKYAKLDSLTSQYSIVVFLFQMMIALGMGITGDVLLSTTYSDHWYLRENHSSQTMLLVIPLRYFLLCSVMIPISFKVLIDLSKYYTSLTISWDVAMYDPKTDCPASVNNSAIAEDLGYVKFLLTDKTGTLTENDMILRDIFTPGMLRPLSLSPESLSDVQQECKNQGSPISTLCRAILLCNTVEKKGNDSFEGTSCDEVAMVQCLNQDLKAKLISRVDGGNTVIELGSTEEWTTRRIIDFTSDRARMSVIVQIQGSSYIISKGSDEKMLPLILPGTYQEEELQGALDELSSRGLRVLTFGMREMHPQEFKDFETQYEEISKIVQIDQQQNEFRRLFATVETKLNFVGITGVEDKLQDGVPECVENLRLAGLHVWMLTGDKVETAKRIGYSTNLFDRMTIVHDLNPSSDLEAMHMVMGIKRSVDQTESVELRSNGTADSMSQTLPLLQQPPTSKSHNSDNLEEMKNNIGIVVPGKCLQFLLSTTCAAQFAKLCLVVRVAIFARVSPAQKASVAAFIQKYSNQVVCCVGDGGNDVPMIQAAHVGVGIRGKEGRQASRAADFSLARFRFLTPLLLVHGHYAAHRASYIVLYSFYKSMLLAFVQVTFNFCTLFSGATFWDSMALMAWNGIFTMPTILLYGLDRVLPRQSLISQPSLYPLVRQGAYFSKSIMLGYIARGIAQAVAVFLVFVYSLGSNWIGIDGDTSNLNSMYTAPYTALITIQTWTILLDSNTVTLWNQIAVWGMFSLYWFSVGIYSLAPTLQYYTVFAHVFQEPTSYFYILLIVFGTFIPEAIVQFYQKWVHPTNAILLTRRRLLC